MGRVIELKTAVPGPASDALMARRTRAVPRGVPAVTPVAVVQADGAILTDADGNHLIDFAGGIGGVFERSTAGGLVGGLRLAAS